jgi:CxxC motif-containing protein (DUF1111 family)
MATWLGLVVLVGLSAQAKGSDASVGGKTIADRPHPPSDRLLHETESARVDLGQSVFKTRWVAAGTPSTVRREGVGPLFNAASCDACHNDGSGGRGPTGDGPAPIALEIQLESPSADVAAEPSGDPVYGRVFNTAALEGVQVEGIVTVRYSEIDGYYYPDGMRWHMRVPHYDLVGLGRGALAPTTVIKPRLAPALFGVGLLEAVPEAAISDGVTGAQTSGRNSGEPAWHSRQGTRMLGRFGWQGDAISIRDQTTKAFAREMGLTSSDRPTDDCTPAESDCLRQPSGGSPEVSEELIQAVVAFQRTLAVPRSPTNTEDTSLGSELFSDIGCATCHRLQLPVELPQSNGTKTPGVIAPYTDLRLHDLGLEMADESASGVKVTSRWRTAPLWGLSYRTKTEGHPTLLHDGRARSAEEAILWHSGEAAPARRKFVNLGPRSRQALLRWLETL